MTGSNNANALVPEDAGAIVKTMFERIQEIQKEANLKIEALKKEVARYLDDARNKKPEPACPEYVAWTNLLAGDDERVADLLTSRRFGTDVKLDDRLCVVGPPKSGKSELILFIVQRFLKLTHLTSIPPIDEVQYADRACARLSKEVVKGDKNINMLVHESAFAEGWSEDGTTKRHAIPDQIRCVYPNRYRAILDALDDKPEDAGCEGKRWLFFSLRRDVQLWFAFGPNKGESNSLAKGPDARVIAQFWIKFLTDETPKSTAFPDGTHKYNAMSTMRSGRPLKIYVVGPRRSGKSELIHFLTKQLGRAFSVDEPPLYYEREWFLPIGVQYHNERDKERNAICLFIERRSLDPGTLVQDRHYLMGVIPIERREKIERLLVPEAMPPATYAWLFVSFDHDVQMWFVAPQTTDGKVEALYPWDGSL